MDVQKPDEKSVMTYVAQFVKAFPDPDAAPSGGAKVGQGFICHLLVKVSYMNYLIYSLLLIKLGFIKFLPNI